MKQLLLFLLLAFTAIQLPAQKPTDSDCNRFHTGTFTSKQSPGVTIERDSLYQTERQEDGTFVKMSITWTSPCTYELRLVETNDRSHKKAWKKIKVLTVTITSVDLDSDSYRFSATSPAMPEAVRGSLVKK